MINFLIRRAITGLFSLLVVVAIVFFVLQMLPGGPFDTEKTLPPEIIKNIEKHYGLDQPVYIQFGRYIWNAVQGDLGVSYSYRDFPVTQLLMDKLPISAELGAYSIILALLLGIPLGVLGAYYHNGLIDYLASFVAIIGRSVPNIALAPLLALFFGLILKWVPVARWTSWDSKILPTVALGLSSAALIARLTRASMLQIIRDDFVRTARAKGLSEPVVMFRHALRNALLPVLTVLGPLIAFSLTGTLVVEAIFAIPGLGRYFVTSIGQRDYPVVMGVYLLFGAIIIILNAVVDALYALVDPRIRLE